MSIEGLHLSKLQFFYTDEARLEVTNSSKRASLLYYIIYFSRWYFTLKWGLLGYAPALRTSRLYITYTQKTH
jgi:hypothetical protein